MCDQTKAPGASQRRRWWPDSPSFLVHTSTRTRVAQVREEAGAGRSFLLLGNQEREGSSRTETAKLATEGRCPLPARS